MKTAQFKSVPPDALRFPAKAIAITFMCVLAFTAIVADCTAESWQAKASIDVDATGLTQAVLPAELLMGNKTDHMT